MTINSWIYLLSTLGLGIFTPVDTYTSIHIGTDSFDSEQPMASLGIEYDVNKVRLFFEHQSSPVTADDYGLNHIGAKYLFDSGLYAGVSKKIDKEFCQLLYEIGMNSFTRFSVHPSPKECLEICLLRMLTFNPLQKLSENNQNSNPGNAEKKSLKKR